jgi:hypothetical protein
MQQRIRDAMHEAESVFITIHEVALLYGCSTRTIKRWIKAGKLPLPINYVNTDPIFSKTAELRWPREAFMRLLKGQTAASIELFEEKQAEIKKITAAVMKNPDQVSAPAFMRCYDRLRITDFDIFSGDAKVALFNKFVGSLLKIKKVEDHVPLLEDIYKKEIIALHKKSKKSHKKVIK